MILNRRTLLAFTIISLAFVSLLLIHQSGTSINAAAQDHWSRVSQTVAQNVGLGGDWSDPAARPARVPYQPGIAKPYGHNYSKVLVVPRIRREDVKWMYDELPEFEKVIYVADDPSAPLHPPKNKGHEVMVYLTYLIDHYDQLPEVIIFMHAHRWSWHNADILGLDAVQMVRRLSPDRVTREGFLNMRCTWYPGCPDWMHPGETEKDPYKSEQYLIAKAWVELFPFDRVPDVLAQPCCSQFALSRERALSISREQYVEYRNWLLRTKLNDFVSGRVWEYMWQFVFTGHSSWCPAEHACYCDGFGVCFGGKAKFDAWFAIRKERDKYNNELRLWLEKKKKIAEALEDGKSTEGMEVPEVGRDEKLRAQVEVLQKEMSTRLGVALDRGMDPKNRAEEAGRPYQFGDGF